MSNTDLDNIENEIKRIKSQDVEDVAAVPDSDSTSTTIDVNPDSIGTAEKSTSTDKLPQTIDSKQSYVKSIGDINSNDFYVTIDKTKNYRDQAAEMAEAAAVVAAVQSDTVREEMVKQTGEQLVEKTKAEAARARADRTEATTVEQKSKSDLYQSMLETFGAYKHYPEWLRKIVVALLTLPYLILLIAIGIPTGIIRFTIECVDGIFIRYDNVNETRKPKVRFITWFLLGLGVVAAVVLPVLKVYNII